MSTRAVRRDLVPRRDAFLWWLKLGFVNFGGPAGQIAIMHDELVDRRRWISNERFLHALNFCMLLPGPEATQLAIYVGWLLNGTLGGIVAGVLFVLPAFLLILGLSWTYAVHGDVTWVAAVFYGLRSAVIGLVVAAVIRVGSKALKTPAAWAVAAAAFVSIFFFDVPFPLIVLGAAIAGLAGSRIDARWWPVGGHADEQEDHVLSGDEVERVVPTWRRSVGVLLLGLAVWWGPLLAVLLWRGTGDTLSKEAVFFSQAALVTFGGAYAVLSYINQAAVQTYGWLAPGQMVTGLGLAESTPGPLIMVTEFVGFLGGYNFPGGLDPVVAGILGATVTTWATFAPCFLWIFLGAPYVERLRDKQGLNAALSAITAAVVGVILNLAVTFAAFALFEDVDGARGFPVPDLSSIDAFAAALAVAAFVALWRYRLNVVAVVLASAGAGLLYRSLA
ncbi:MAG TPA: chromate efflux transporter [Actinomycetota bacterium]|nr:chromate efflux transporter [Actinomycetota bacterium]